MVYNFICRHEAPGGSDANELSDQDDNQHNEDSNQHNKDDNKLDDPAPAVDAVGAHDQPWQLRKDITGAMWVDYQTLLVQRVGGNADDHISDGSSNL